VSRVLADRIAARLSALAAAVARPAPSSPPPSPGYFPSSDLAAWANQYAEKVRVAASAGRWRFLPRVDVLTDETGEIRALYPVMLRDDTVKAAWLKKTLTVCALDLQVHCDDPDLKHDPHTQRVIGDLKYAFSQLDGRPRHLAWEVLAHAAVDGWSFSEIVMRPHVEASGRLRGKRTWHAVKAKRPNRLQPISDPYYNVIAYRGQVYNAGHVWQGEDLESFIHYSHLPLYSNPLGMSDFRAAYRAFVRKDTAEKLWSLAIDRFASPALVGRYTTEEQRAALESALENLRSNTWASLPVGAILEAFSFGSTGAGDYKDFISQCNDEILTALVGATLHMQTGDTPNARGNTQVQQEVSELLDWYLAATLGDAVTKQMVRPWLEHNYADPPPLSASWGAVSTQALLDDLKLFEGLKALGVPLSRSDTYERFHVQEPSGPGDVLGGSPPGQPPGPGPKPPGGGAPVGFAEGESYFGTCPRDEAGHCKPKGEGDESGRGDGGESPAPGGPKIDLASLPRTDWKGRPTGDPHSPYAGVEGFFGEYPGQGTARGVLARADRLMDSSGVTDAEFGAALGAPAQVDVRTLRPTQYIVDLRTVGSMADSPEFLDSPDRDDWPVVGRSGGELYLLNGHNRLAAGLALGRLTAKVNVVDLDGPPPPRRHAEGEPESALESDPDSAAGLMADVLYGLLGAKALGALTVREHAGRWDESLHPRDEHTGKFIPRGSHEAYQSAREAVGAVLRGTGGGHTAAALAGHLHVLTVEQLRGLHAEHGVRPPGRLRARLVEAIKARLGAGAPEPKPRPRKGPAGPAAPGRVESALEKLQAAGKKGRDEAVSPTHGGHYDHAHLVPVAHLARELGVPPASIHETLMDLWRAGRVELTPSSGGGAPAGWERAAIPDPTQEDTGGGRFAFVSLRRR
jgi:hypothetical protein